MSKYRFSGIPAEIAGLATAAGSLGRDFDNLERVWRGRVPEAVVFFSARILDVLVGEITLRVSGDVGPQVFSNLAELHRLGVVSNVQLAVLHALRMMGNDARHVLRPLDMADATLALALLERLVTWACPLLGPTEIAATATVAFPASSRIRSALQGLDAAWASGDRTSVADKRWALEEYRRAVVDIMNVSPGLLWLYLELLIRAGDPMGALGAIEGLPPERRADLRVRQLEAWAVRKAGPGDSHALRLFEALLAEDADDDETRGFLGGIYKDRGLDRTFFREPNVRKDYLQKAFKCYHDAWTRSKRTNTYVGVNAAAVSVFQGDKDRAHRIARAVMTAYDRRANSAGSVSYFDYWDRATHAELLLLLGRMDAARQHYRIIQSQRAGEPDSWARTREQLENILEHLDYQGGVEAFLAPPEGSAGEPESCPAPFDSTASSPLTVPRPPDPLSIALEDVAERVHEIWRQKRSIDGWTYGSQRDDRKKRNPNMQAYARISDEEKEYDRAVVRVVVDGLRKKGWTVEP
jgi:hypothetical protein